MHHCQCDVSLQLPELPNLDSEQPKRLITYYLKMADGLYFKVAEERVTKLKNWHPS